MRDSLCRLVVRSCVDGDERSADLAVPVDMPVGELIPELVDLVYPQVPDVECRWHLSRVGEAAFDDATTLYDNGVRDGELLLLTTTRPPAPEWVDLDATHTLARVAETPRTPPMVPVMGCVGLGGLSAAILVCATPVSSTPSVVTAAALATGAGVGAVVAERRRAGPTLRVPLSLVAVVLAAAVGFLVVPPGPAADHALLASAAALCGAIALARLTGCDTTLFAAVVTLCGVGVVVAGVASAWRLTPGAAGAALATLSLAVVGLAPRAALAVARITPAAPDVADRGTVADAVLSGFVVGASLAVAVGAVIVAVDLARGSGSRLAGLPFIAVISLVLALRMRTHRNAVRQIGLGVSALAAMTAGLVAAAATARGDAHIAAALAATVGAALLIVVAGVSISPLVSRAIEVFEYVAIAAVVPLAFWVGGLYGVVRGLSLT